MPLSRTKVVWFDRVLVTNVPENYPGGIEEEFIQGSSNLPALLA